MMRGIFGRYVPAAALVLGLLAVTGCMAGKRVADQTAYPTGRSAPQVVAVLPADMSLAYNATEGEANSEDAEYVGTLARGILQNHLAGKGYRPLALTAVDLKLASLPGWRTLSPQKLAESLGAQGIVFLDVSGWAMLDAIALENYMLSATVRMVDGQGMELGSWAETGESSDVSIPTSFLGLASSLLGTALGDSPRTKFRHVAYDWGWKVAQVIPDCQEGRSLPEILLVDTNVGSKPFAAGEKVVVRVFAEKDLVASFDIGRFRQNIPMRTVGEGEYEGVYVVREGETASHEPVVVRVARPNGIERQWVDPLADIGIDAVLPPGPVRPKAEAGAEGVRLSWGLPEGEEVAAFVVERNDSPVGNWAEVSRVEELTAVDPGVSQGQIYYYRVRAVDTAGNLSSPRKPLEVPVPRFERMVLQGELKGTLIAGEYLVQGDAMVPSGELLRLMSGARVTFSSGSALVVQGRLDATGSREKPIVLTGSPWDGIRVPSGGVARLAECLVSGAHVGIQGKGSLEVVDTELVGGGTGLGVMAEGLFALDSVQLSDWETALVIAGGDGMVDRSNLTGNDIGVRLRSGTFRLSRSNLHGNRINIVSDQVLAVRENYLGEPGAAARTVSGQVILKSVLDAPFPDGRVIALMDDADLSADEVAARFDEHKQKGIELFNERRYGDAQPELARALMLQADRDVSLYLAYTLMELGERGRADEVLRQGIQAFPYDYRLRQVHVRHLLASGRYGEAALSVDKALDANPEDANLRYLKELVDDEARRARLQPSGSAR